MIDIGTFEFWIGCVTGFLFAVMVGYIMFVKELQKKEQEGAKEARETYDAAHRTPTKGV